jgi:hypothetical protein
MHLTQRRTWHDLRVFAKVRKHSNALIGVLA